MALNPRETDPPGTSGDTVQADNDAGPGGRAGLPLGRRLCDLGLISESQLQTALRAQARSPHRMLSAILTELGFLSDESLAGLFADPGSAPASAFDPDCALVDPAAVSLVAREVALKHHLLPLAAGGGVVTVAVGQGFKEGMAEDLKAALPAGSRLELRYWPDRDLAEAIEAAYARDLRLPGILTEMAAGIGEGGVGAATLASNGWRNPVVRLVNALVLEALRLGADTVQFEGGARDLRIGFRAAGVRFDRMSVPAPFWRRISERLDALTGGEDAAAARLEHGTRTLEASLVRSETLSGAMAVLRLHEVSRALPKLQDLGFAPRAEDIVARASARPGTCLLICGPRRSGRTTGLQALLAAQAEPGDTLLACGVPAGAELDGFHRMADGAEALRAALTQDPDGLLIDDIAAPGLAQAAVEAAHEGVRVYAGIAALDSLGALSRLRQCGLSADQIAGFLSGIVSQRLVGRLCPICKVSRPPNEAERALLGLGEEGSETLCEPKGCPSCRESGYKGRILIAEAVPVDSELADLIAGDAPRLELQEALRRGGIRSLAEDAADKVLRGEASLAGVARAVDLGTLAEFGSEPF